MNSLSPTMLIAALFFGTATQGFAVAAGTESNAPRQAQASPSTRTVFIKLDDINFSQKSIDVRPGETVRFVLKNEGALMHEFNIGRVSLQHEHQREMAALMQDGTLTPTGKAKSIVWRERNTGPGDSTPPSYPEVIEATHDDPNAVLVEPGTTKEFVWTFADATNLTFACTLPGHTQAGMIGDFVMR
ncbi:plastocyanin [Metapseudomonas furukawaii]|uniref:cupredoxin domain-containing protein n=1 Tax=Metapseudomonas furukawaii TaxID=1149133 RepID=UPI00227CDFBB|nr:plastocyanin/azurin family copper-binding protein [Pseudomonas furukawaii]WAG78969.1 plastocyanin [Pseudomonas furukawaii]